MAETISPELEQFVQWEIETGRFPNREAVIEHALRLLHVSAGRLQPLDEAFSELRRELDRLTCGITKAGSAETNVTYDTRK